MSITKKLLLVLGLFCVIILWFLLRPRSSHQLAEDKFVEVYVELSMVKEMFGSDTLKLEEERDRIFEKAGVTQAEIDDFINRLNQKPQGWSEVWKKIVERLEERRQDIK